MKSDTNRFKEFFASVLNAGIFMAPSQYEAVFLSSKHTKSDIDKTVSIISDALNKIF